MKIITQVEEFHYQCDECKRNILQDIDERLMGTVTYGVWSSNNERVYKRTKHFCNSCLRKKGLM